MASYVEELAVFLGWEVDDEGVKKFNKQIKDVVKFAAKATAALGAAAGAVAALTVATSKEIAEQENLARSVGLSGSALQALTGVVKNLGMESMLDLYRTGG